MTNTLLENCPFCGIPPEKNIDGFLLCGNANCPASVIRTSPETWNKQACLAIIENPTITDDMVERGARAYLGYIYEDIDLYEDMEGVTDREAFVKRCIDNSWDCEQNITPVRFILEEALNGGDDAKD